MKIVPDVHLFIRKRMKGLIRIPTHSFIPFNQRVFHRVRTPKSGTVLSKVFVMRKYSYLFDSSVYEVVLLVKQLDTQKHTGFVFFLWTRLQTHSRKKFLFEALFKTSSSLALRSFHLLLGKIFSGIFLPNFCLQAGSIFFFARINIF